ncbi:MAG TPA: serine hydrolase [Isosphaeraceae bacterium]|jgi:CubicO group peptidase (beta-lactamase class C family)|nr:serine hydrolase [Isosphaeraceae bacterium]
MMTPRSNPLALLGLAPILLIATTALAVEDGSPDRELPPHIRRVTSFGERADWSHDGRKILFVEKTFGDVYEVEVATGALRLLTAHYPHVGYTRALYLANGDILLSGPERFDPKNPGPSRVECFLSVLDQGGTKPPVPLGTKCSEGPAVSRKRMHIAWTHVAAQYPDEMPAGSSRIFEADIVTDNGTPRLENRRLVLDSRDLPFRCTLECQNFRPPDERELTFSAYGHDGTEVCRVDLATKAVVNDSKAPGQYDEPEGIFPDGRWTCVESDREGFSGRGPNHVDIWKLSLDGRGTWERLTTFNKYPGYKASNPVISDDGRFMAFQMARSKDPSGVGYGIFIDDFARADGKPPAGLSAIRERMQRFVDHTEIAGAVTVVGTKDEIRSLEAVGQANIEAGTTMRPETLFRIASMTKPITALGVMILADEGKLSIDDPVEKHLPEFRGQMMIVSRSGDEITLRKPPRPITLRDLLTHTSGLPGGMPPGLADLYAKRNRALAEEALVSSQRPLEFEPGSRWAYCNAGIDTLGRVIEVVAGEPYEAFLKRRIFDPLSMADTTFDPTPVQLRRSAATYDRKGDRLVSVDHPLIGPPSGSKHPVPAGGLYSTAPDLAKLYQMMLRKGVAADGKRILSEKAVVEMTRVQTGDLKCGFTDGMGYGLGWGVVRAPSGVTAMLSPGTFGHGGAFGTQAWIDPVKGRFVILMIQRVGLPNADASEFRREFQRLAFEDVAK